MLSVTDLFLIHPAQNVSESATTLMLRSASTSKGKWLKTGQSQSKIKEQQDNSTSHEPPSSTKPSTKRQVSWLTDKNKDGKSSLDLLVEWITTGQNYELWRRAGGTRNKYDITQTVVQYLEAHGIQGSDARGVEQQISQLESEYRAASDWLAETGQRRIQDKLEADQRRKLSEDSGSNS